MAEGQPVGVDANAAPAAELDWTGRVETPEGPVKAAIVFHLWKARVMEREIADAPRYVGVVSLEI